MSGVSPAGEPAAAHRAPPLTPRQREILRLLCEGKVNKEIARELGIGVGTVKQHVVALFKRLNVRNRAMAVSHGMALLEASETVKDAVSAPLAEEGILVRRPCVVLCVALPAEAPAEAARRLHRTLAGLAYDGGALFLAREGGAGDLMFGVRHASEHDLVAALQLAMALHEEVREHDPRLAAGLRGGLGAGMAIVSKRRHGGWSGEAVASPVIAAARKRLAETAAGDLCFDPPVREVMASFGLGGVAGTPGCLPFVGLARLFRVELPEEGDGADLSGPGREAEWRRLAEVLAAGEGRLLRLEGESGMGKSRLCRAAAARSRTLGGRVTYLRGLPVAGVAALCDAADGAPLTEAAARARFERPPGGPSELLLVDDFHLLPGALRDRVAQWGEAAAAGGRVVVLAGRRVAEGERCERLHLRRIDDQAVAALLRQGRGDGIAEDRARIARHVGEAAGVPFFARELARAGGALSLPLLMVVISRLDGFELDWKLLHTVARGPGPMALPALAEALAEPLLPVERAAAAAVRVGVLTHTPAGEVAFHHPLVRRIVAQLGVEWGGS
ncbi:LuxR C-terminal-related transcriptional regulator [Endothiovibrio diazotrophicus]